MRKIVIYTWFLLCCIGFCTAQPGGVKFAMADVDSNGYVALQWTFSFTPQTSFQSYVLQRKNAATGLYDVIYNTQNIQNQQFVDSASNALADSVKYRILAIVADTGADTTFVDSAITILPSVFNVQNQSQYAYISWNAQYPPSGQFLVYRKMPHQPARLIASTQQTHYQDTIRQSICSDTIFYKVSYLAGTYHAQSDFSGAWFNDPYPTTPCTLDVATVDTATQNIVLSWQPSPDPDIMGYFICQGSPCMALDTVWGQHNTTYTCTTRSSDSINTFRIYAFDSCFSASALTDPYNNMVLEMEAHHCTRNISFRWNQYINMPGNVSQYTLYLKYDNAPFRPVANEPAGSRGTTYTIPAGVRQVRAYVVASNAGSTKRSFSNKKTFDMMTVDTAEFIHVLGVSVDDQGDALRLKFLVDTQFAANGYTLYRRVGNGLYHNYTTLPPSATPIIDYLDLDADPLEHTYSYYLSVWDECELIEKKSNRASQIYATLGTGDDGTVVSWTPYDGAGTLLRYNVLRKNEGENSWTTIASLQQCQTTDNTALYGRAQYLVQAEYLNPQNNQQYIAQSQVVEYHGTPSVWVPNAFTPNRDNNNRFLPQMSFVKNEGYKMSIYNRFGLLVFETNNPAQPWDGRHNGKTVPAGTYVYIIQYLGDDNYSNLVRGTVTVLK